MRRRADGRDAPAQIARRDGGAGRLTSFAPPARSADLDGSLPASRAYPQNFRGAALGFATRPRALISEDPGKRQSADSPVLLLSHDAPARRHAAREPAQRAHQRRRDRRTAPPAQRAAPPGQASRVPTGRPYAPRGARRRARRGLDGLAGHRPLAAPRVAAKPLLVVARARKPSHASSTADPGPRGWAGAAAAHPGAGPGNGWPAHRGRSSRLPPSPSRSRTCAGARHVWPPRPVVSNTAVPVHQVVRAMVPWAMADNRSPSGCGSTSSQRVMMSRWPALMTQVQASRRSPRTGASILMV